MAMGQVFLARINEKRVTIAQFLKTGKNCGECQFFRNVFKIKFLSFGKDEFYVTKEQSKEFQSIIKKGISERCRSNRSKHNSLEKSALLRIGDKNLDGRCPGRF